MLVRMHFTHFVQFTKMPVITTTSSWPNRHGFELDFAWLRVFEWSEFAPPMQSEAIILSINRRCAFVVVATRSLAELASLSTLAIWLLA